MDLESITYLLFCVMVGAGIGFVAWLIVGRFVGWKFMRLGLLLGAIAGGVILPIVTNSFFSTVEVGPVKETDQSVLLLQKHTSENAVPIDENLVPEQTGTASNILLATLINHNETFLETMTAEPDVNSINADEYALTVGVDEALKYLPRATDNAIVTLIEGLAITTQTLVQENPNACYGWLYGGYGYEGFDFPAFRAAVGGDLLELQFKLYARLVESAGGEVPLYDSDLAAGAVSQANFQMLQVAGFENAGLLTGEYGPQGSAEEKQQDRVLACTARYVFYQALLSDENSAAAIRHLFLKSR